MSFQFEHIEYLIALGILPILIILFLYLLKWKRSTKKKIGDPKLVEQLVKNYSPFKFALKFSLLLLALTAIVVAAANLRKPGHGDNSNRKGVDVMMVLDVSKSMLAQDYKPDRLERAKQLMIRLMDKMPEDRIGLVLFAGRAYMQMPLTNDHGAARLFIQDASPAAVPTQGTVISEALKMANTAFNSQEKKFKVIVLISDGEDHEVEAGTVAKNLAENGVMINTIGVGSPEGSVIIDPESGVTKKDAEGNTVISKLNEPTLQELATVSNGIYLKLDDVDDATNKILAQLDTIEQKSLQDVASLNYKTYFQWFVAAALILLVVEFFVSEKRKLAA